MSHFHQAIMSLMARVESASCCDIRLVQKLVQQPSFTFIDWLEAQPLFPKFYWQSRDKHEEVVALGQLQMFSDPTPAYEVLQGEQRIWGGRSFDGQSAKNPHCLASLFFLPHIELIRVDESWSLAVNLSKNKQETLSALRQLTYKVRALPPLTTTVKAIDHTPNQSQWGDLVTKALDSIVADEFKKVVLARCTTLSLEQPIRAAQLLKASHRENHDSFHFMMSLDEKRSFMGSTPERLYRRHGRELQTEALAGTIGRGKGRAQDQELANWLANDEKNLNENQYVVDDIVQSLQSFSHQVIVQNQPHLIRLRKVQHLKRHIEAKLHEGVNGVQLLDALQPTAAVAGLPRKEAVDFIQQHEPFPRGWYAGSIGYISLHKAEFCVAIRSALVVDKQIKLFAGAGIVPGSIAGHEWQELNKKMSTLLSLIAEPPLLGAAS
ncbi:isochorismate synthase [Vibrio sp. 10N.286.49.B3]|uniref:isochorismate synthase n=1 Tax=Vibrio sp. 10N.286.49.B3 TaxID=1880855 RepID=UPI000CB7BAE0|nr:isochorismate synthase [Vibrio sp. 10N.286.49.B3]PMH41870.1 isochorismate synthase [Vibrio sp. 10N.286.49.B3]